MGCEGEISRDSKSFQKDLQIPSKEFGSWCGVGVKDHKLKSGTSAKSLEQPRSAAYTRFNSGFGVHT